MKYFFVFLIMFSSIEAYARGFHAFAGLGITMVPSSLRFGNDDWEGGLINQNIGFDKIFNFGSNYYSSFGIVFASGVGFYSSMGLKTSLWFIPVRCELAASFYNNGDSSASGLVGVTYGF